MAHKWYTVAMGLSGPGKVRTMPRRKLNPYPLGSAEFMEEEDRRAAESVATERNITVTVTLEAIAAAKSLGTLSGIPYRQVLGHAAQQGVEALTTSVRKVLLDGSDEEIPY